MHEKSIELLNKAVADELSRRRSTWQPPEPVATRGWSKLYVDHVTQANTGVDLDFLVGSSGSTVARESH